MKILKITALVFLSLISIDSFAEDKWSLVLGLNFRQATLDVYDPDVGVEPIGILKDDFKVLPHLSLDSASKTLNNNGTLAYKISFNLDRIDMSTQQVNDNNVIIDVDAGTSAEGYYFYAMPVIYYEFFGDNPNQALRLGAGLGLGIVKAKGDIFIYENYNYNYHSFDINKFTYSYGLMLEYERKNWLFIIGSYTPEVTQNGYKYNIFETSFSIRRKFYF